MRHLSILIACIAATGCAVGGDPESADSEQIASEATASTLYQYVSPLAPGSQGFGPLALRRANAKPGTFNSTYGAATLPKLKLASDAVVTQAELDAVVAIPYAGHETSVVALFGGRSTGSLFSEPTFEVVEIYTPSQSVSISSVAQKDALYQLVPAGNKITVRLLNEKDYSASTAPSFVIDTAATTNPAAARVAVQGGAFFSGKVDIACHKFLLWTTCDPPSAVHVTSYFAAN